jgi:hypothetical protein
MIIEISTRFNCTATATTGNFRPHILPFQDAAGNTIIDIASWTRSRNQQRNFETLCQIVSMRTQLESVTNPEARNGLWYFTVIPERPDVFHNLNGLYSDCQGVPMIVGLGEQPDTTNTLQPEGADSNIWFKINI